MSLAGLMVYAPGLLTWLDQPTCVMTRQLGIKKQVGQKTAGMPAQ